MTSPDESVDERSTTYSVVELNSLVRDTLRRAHPRRGLGAGRGAEPEPLAARATPTSRWSRRPAGATGSRAGSTSRCSATTAEPSRRALAEVPGAELGNDVEVRIRGRVTVYPPTGRYQLVMTGIDPVFTVGRHRRQPRAGAAGARRPKACSTPTPRLAARAGAAARRS